MAFAPLFDLASLNNQTGLRLLGAADQDLTGASVSSAGDVNGDGVDDLLIGAVRFDPSGRADGGAAYLVFGKASGWTTPLDLATLTNAQGIRLDGVSSQDNVGYSVSSAGDVNGDGLADLIIGQYNLTTGVGSAYVVFGHSGGWSGPINLASMPSTQGVHLTLSTSYGHIAVSSAGDVNGDGIDDIVVGTPVDGKAYVVFGHSGAWSNGDIGTLAGGSTGFQISGSGAVGYSVSAAGDVNGDGVGDVIVGAGTGAGAAYVIFGEPGGGPTISLGSLTAAQGFKISHLQHVTLPVSGAGLPATRMVASHGARVEPVTYWFTTGDTVVLSYWDREWAQMRYAMSGYVPDGYLVRISTLSDNPNAAFQRELDFANALMAQLKPELRRRLVGHA